MFAWHQLGVPNGDTQEQFTYPMCTPPMYAQWVEEIPHLSQFPDYAKVIL